MTHQIGSLKSWLQGYWIKVGAELMKNEGCTSVSPEMKREWMLRYIDGESPSAPNVAHFWLNMNKDEKLRHLEDAFPKDESVA